MKRVVAGPDLAELAAGLMERCDRLALCSDEPGRLTRTFLSPATREAQALVTGWMASAGLAVRRDAMGNLTGRRGPGGAPALVIGSHLDTVPDAGRYDGALGVLVGIAAAEALREADLPFALEVVAFAEEEGVRFSVPFLGSRAVAGTLEPRLLMNQDAGGRTVLEAVRDFGLKPNELPLAQRRPEELLAYLEIHIEQGPVLDTLGLPLGVVGAISGQSRLALTLRGRAAHAGTTPMADRLDALAGAAELVLEAERLARATPGLVATVGRLGVSPGVGNVVPGEAELYLDVRHPDDATRAAAVARLVDFAGARCDERRLELSWDTLLEQPAVPLDPELGRLLEEAVSAAGHPVHRLPSGAGHDAMVMAGLAPAAMIFVRSPGGVSHHPDEAARPEDVLAALAATVGFVERLGGRRA